MSVASFRKLKMVNDPSVRLVCFPYAGGNANGFRSWVEHLDRDVELLAYEPAGLGSRVLSAPSDRMGPVVDDVLTGLAGLDNRPWVLFGHSLGGLVAYETVLALRDTGHDMPAHVVVSGSRPPTRAMRGPSMRGLKREGFIQRLREMQGTPEEVLNSQELMDFLLPSLRAQFEISESYIRANPPQRLPITGSFFFGQEDPMVQAGDHSAWEACFSGQLAAQAFPGGHFFVDHEARRVASTVNQLLRRFADTNSSLDRTEAG